MTLTFLTRKSTINVNDDNIFSIPRPLETRSSRPTESRFEDSSVVRKSA
ncbi:MAG: hypothetical protein KDK23_14700 [Leptospiraceae bacterium]|nr:hypothetical protein [Leptospiraceae bacterium]